MTALVYGQDRTITEATTIRTILMDRTDTIITIGALTTFRPTGFTDIISTAAGTAGIVTKIGMRMTSKPQAGIKKSRAFEYCRRAPASVRARPDARN